MKLIEFSSVKEDSVTFFSQALILSGGRESWGLSTTLLVAGMTQKGGKLELRN